MSGALQAVFQNQRSFGPPPGQQAFITSGTFTWVAPTGITKASVVVVGGGGAGAQRYNAGECGYLGQSGAGGSLSYKNNITVTPGGSYTVVVGAGGVTSQQAGGQSYFCNTCLVRARGGNTGATNTGDASFIGGGGNGCSGSTGGGGGGGAGGYSGAGGLGAANTCSGAGGSGGAGGGGASGTTGTGGGGGGGGVGLLGQGSSGGRGSNFTGGGGGGSSGANGSNGFKTGCAVNGGAGGAYGGGGGSSGITNCSRVQGAGGVGAVRVIWPGNTRSFPSTCTGDK